ncbi:MAG: ABC transporter permease [Sediminispirochaetaceae bacterium]
MKLRKDYSSYFVLGAAVVFVAIFLVYPLMRTVLLAFVPKGEAVTFGNFGFQNFDKFWESSLYLRSLVNSLYISISVVLFTSLIGIPMGYLVARVDLPFKRLLLSLGILPIIMPAFVGAFSWIIVLGRQGAIRVLLSHLGIELPPIYGPFGIIFSMTMMYYPFTFLLTEGAFETANPTLEESAATMGARLPRILRTIDLPLILPSIGAGTILVFIRAIDNFGIPAVIGGNTYVLPTLIYFRVNGFWDLNSAAAISLIIVVITVFALWVQKYIISRREYETISASRSKISLHSHPLVKILAGIFCWGIIIISLLPQITLLVMSFFTTWNGLWPKGFTFGNYAQISQFLSGPIKNSLYLATTASLGAAVIGTLVAYIIQRRAVRGSALLDYAVMLPFILPGIVVAVALLTAFSSGPLLIRGTFFIIFISYVIRRTPYVFRAVSAGLTQLDPSLEEASILSGATWFYTFKKVTFPLIFMTIASGTILTFATLLKELSTTILLYSAKTRTLPIAIYDSVNDGNFGLASALSTVLFVVVLGVTYGINRYTGKSMAASFRAG